MPDLTKEKANPMTQLTKFEESCKDARKIQMMLDGIPLILQTQLSFTEEDLKKIWDFQALLIDLGKRNVDKHLEAKSYFFTYFEETAKKENV